MNKKLIFIVGKTASGKDTIARYLRERYGIGQVVSYATRPIRACEKDGREHWFVSPERMREILCTEKVIAYTKFPKTGYEYAATVKSMQEDVMTYIINPDGVKWFKEHRPKGIETVTVFVDTDEDVIRSRAAMRGDDPAAVEARLNSEREQFNAFRESGEYDLYINGNLDKDSVYREVESIVRREVA